MTNASNNGNLIGRLAADPKAFMNTDGSKKVLFTLYVDRNYKGADNKTISDQVRVEAFLNNKVDGLGPFAYAHQGDLVALSTHIEQLPYTAKNGEKVYPDTKVIVDGIQFLESRATTQTRMARRSVAAAPAAAEGETAQAAPAEQGTSAEGANAYDNEAPFADANAG